MTKKYLSSKKENILSKYEKLVEEVDIVKSYGKVERVSGLTIETLGPEVKYGDLCRIKISKDKSLFAEVVGFTSGRVILMPLGDMTGLLPGADVHPVKSSLMVPVGEELLGRVLSGLGAPIDGRGKIFTENHYPLQGREINPLKRKPIDKPLSVGVRSIDALLTIGRGQRIGIFSGSGIGKSTLLGMIARYTEADVNVIALIGERSREVKEFIDKELGEEGLKKSVVVVATSDQPPLVRLRGAFLAITIAEYFRDQGRTVNLIMDSVTRFAMAQREIGLAVGEPSTTRGYPPSVFSLLPRLLERAGTSELGGSITGFYSVLVEGDDLNEPIADAVRSILDGHIILDRKLANKGHYPPVDVLSSISRCMKDVVDSEHQTKANKLKELLAAYSEAEDLISLGAYVKGSNLVVDEAIERLEDINLFLKQRVEEGEKFTLIRSKLLGLFKEIQRPLKQNNNYYQAPSLIPSFAQVLR